jgi:DNA-binding NtrC family response regulator
MNSNRDVGLVDSAISKPTLLLVEDSIDLRWITAEMLRSEGFRVFEATNSADAFALMNSGLAVDLVFSDINMPGADNGYALARWCKDHRPGVPVLLTSGKPEDSAAHAHDRLSQFVAKPCEPRQLLKLMRNLLAEREHGKHLDYRK